MKKTTLSIIALVAIIAVVVMMMVGCSQSATSSSSAPTADVSSYVKPYDEDPASTAYKLAFEDVNMRWPWAERGPKARYASLAADYADTYLAGDEDWFAQSADLMAEITAELDQSQAEIQALMDSGQGSPRLDPYNLGHAEVGGGLNDDPGPGIYKPLSFH